MSASSAAADTASSTAQLLRQQGNVAFGSSRWLEAANLYTRAIEDLSRGDVSAASSKEDLAALFSNRAAARIKLFQLDLALLDAAAAKLLNPTWSRPLAREAEAHLVLQDHSAARASYTAAARLAEDDATRTRFTTSATSAAASLDAQGASLFGEAEAAVTFAERYDNYVKAGGDPEKDELVSAATAVYAWTTAAKALEQLDDKLDVKESGEVEASSPSPVLDLADAIITDARGFHVPKGKSHELPLSEKLRLQLAWDARVLELDQYLKPATVPRDVIDSFDEQVQREGWQKPKIALAHLIRGSFVAAYVNQIQLRAVEAASQYRFVLGLLSEGRARWQDVAEEDKGSTFRFTFERKVKMHLIDTLVDGHFRSSTPDERARFPLLEVQGLAEQLMDDCNSEKAPHDPVSTFAFQVQPVVSAGKAFAYALRTRAALPEHRIEFVAGHWINCGLSKAAARMYATAGQLLPRDDPEKAVNLFNSLAFDLRGGGVTFDQLFARATEAEAALEPPEEIFGPSPRLFDSRQLVRHACACARDSLVAHLPARLSASAFQLVIKPVPAVFPDRLPTGRERWEDCLEPELRCDLPGDLAVAEFVEASGRS
ncbi:hypothetical protein JCM3775_006676 [Rhodotorula graminis]|uniref:Uncharacterized protein n=1 Tax=Rhodotorula graminis (strain WP1) TaxID=578459 RepID=A0A194SCM5_RHOGW|nr:uncharacterized protein RHOBADRAFT_52094 [Rhodotorula graminis WP1]KPV77146.1 hypothetical protein RHOBADRAFT_52094 [Rhodotorula graminis WP1]